MDIGAHAGDVIVPAFVERKDEAEGFFDSGEAWGNFPQTYSHVGLITAAMRLSRSWQEAS